MSTGWDCAFTRVSVKAGVLRGGREQQAWVQGLLTDLSPDSLNGGAHKICGPVSRVSSRKFFKGVGGAMYADTGGGVTFGITQMFA